MAQATGPLAVRFSVNSERVKMVDIHVRDPIFIAAHYNGVLNLWNYETETLVRSFDTTTGMPVRCVRFIPKLQSFVCGCDDMNLRVYNYNTMERTKVFQAHIDYIRSIAVHDQQPIVLTCSDDETICQWDWSKDWTLQMTYRGHQNYCMAVALNPGDPSTFASASLDGTVMVWSINISQPKYFLEGHTSGVNCVEYYPRGDKPYLLSGSDDCEVRLWDYQTKACLHVFTFHSKTVTAVLFHPDVPLIFTVAEDTSMKVISSETFRLFHSLDHNAMGRGWTMASRHRSNVLVVGYDGGFTVFKVGEAKPIFSMDTNGRVLIAQGNEIHRLDIKGIPENTPDGEVLSLVRKDLGTVETSGGFLQHSTGGQSVVFIGGGEYTILSTLALRPKSYGSGISFAWGPESSSYAVLETSMTLKIYKNFKIRATLSLPEPANHIFAGPVLCVATSANIMFYDWASLSIIRVIDTQPTMVQWSGSGEGVSLVTAESIFLLKYNSGEVAEYVKHNPINEDGLESSFDLIEEIEEKVRDLLWIGECIVFITQTNRLKYYIGGDINAIAVVSRDQYLLGYVAKEGRIFCIDKENNVTSYALKVSILEYMAAIAREDYSTAEELLKSIEDTHKPKIAHFLESRGLHEMALRTTTDDAHRFELAVRLKDLELAQQLADRIPEPARWKQVGDIALDQGCFDIATDAYWKCGDYCGLLLIFTSVNDFDSVSLLGDKCVEKNKLNLAFTCFHLVQRYADASALLCKADRFAEAAFYARTYSPDMIEGAVEQWKESLSALPHVRDAIANPASYPNLFPNIKFSGGSSAPDPAEKDEGLPQEEPVGEERLSATLSTPATPNESGDQDEVKFVSTPAKEVSPDIDLDGEDAWGN
ncbi:unnamed protein product [Phytomonas sp. Hart1]|nr:unnamed protein product [Phytomonas sp. Hart1]|eukprot:CCW69365.1 unnamed protein product [Phytomonas sp. isolate Hart1]